MTGFDFRIKTICDKLRSSNCAGALQYVPEISWLLFLRFFDAREEKEIAEAEIGGWDFRPAIDSPYRWRDWASSDGLKRRELQDGASEEIFHFLKQDLLPYLHALGAGDGASPRQRLISQITWNVNQTRVDTERNFLDVVDLIDQIKLDSIDDQHQFALSQAYEKLLLDMGEKNNDGGQFYTPREVVRAMVEVVDPQLGEKIYDPCCGTGGFLAQSFEHMRSQITETGTGPDLDILVLETFWGREKDNIAYPITLANLVLHGIDFPHIWHGNTLTRTPEYAELYAQAPELYDVILTNPPFGGKEGKGAQTRYDFKTSSTQVLFLQEVIDSLKEGGRAGFVVDEGLLFRTNEKAFVQTKQKLLDECDLYCIVSVAPGAFTTAGSGIKTNLLFFNKGQRTEKIWYYDLLPRDGERFTKGSKPTLEDFEEFFELLPGREDSERSWTVSRAEIEERNYDLKAVNPHRPDETDTRTPEELLAEIEAHGRELDAALAELRKALAEE